MGTHFLKKRYSIRIVWLFILILCITFLGAFIFIKYFLNWNTRDSVDFTAKLTVAFLGLLTLIYHLHNLELQIETQINNNKQNLAKYTYDICSDFRKPGMSDINEDVRCLIKKHDNDLSDRQGIIKFYTYLEDPANRGERQALNVTLNYFESISAMVLAGDLDNDIVKRLFGKLFGRYYLKLQYYIAYRQEESSKSWINFENLAKRWIKEEKD